MRDFMFRILYTAQDGSKTLHYPDDKTLMIGLDGTVYENYGTKEKPMWENVFDAAEPPIIQQSTEVRDKYKMLIYEGDIIKGKFGGNEEIGEVVYHRDGFVIFIKNDAKDYYRTLYYSEDKEVIGNILQYKK